ncbi:non-structural maintenance of chromosomes element 4 homolog A [Selaginella moellendorffii]|uniref:non-structural maintenance of chromosomes element 4 homolog A n=1 Tax=Selaginella moellendorffii TaxID=88036 RepID=UPI000D1CDFFF|nr:non-structural maintenance of chromosomes element 4 homolog A [Selaginella moellendorffii]|eukprot:XP_024529657.1 non-structural maintenance of chromosomes element 4 homolog A [Selaginella moellendorffii]
MARGESSRMGSSRRRSSAGDFGTPAPTQASQEGGSGPQMSASELRSIRSCYRDLKSEISGEKDDIVRDSQKFNVLIGRVDSLYNKVERPREQIADLEAIRDLSACVVQYAKGMQQNGGPTSADFCSVAIHKCKDGGGIDWMKLGYEASEFICDAPGLSTMVGPMDIVPKQRKRPAPRTREKPGPSTRPQEVEAVENMSTETDKNIETMFRILRTHKRVRFEALVLKRKSFAQTIENIFALSFLVKDGRVEISCDNGVIHIVPKNAPSKDDRASGNVVNTQFVLRLDYQDWVTMHQSLDENQELMPDRVESAAAATVTPIRKTSRNRARETVPGSQSQADEQEEEEGSQRRPRKSRRLRLESN